VNIYDVFRRLIEARPFQDFERTEALHLLDELEQMNVLGTVARQTTEGHEHDWIPVNGYYGRAGFLGVRERCRICSLEREVT
jgi:hypothetical protein